MSRKLDNWIGAWTEALVPTNSPELFRKWAGVSAISGALERRVWVNTRGSALYPNIYTILLGPAGVGKTAVTSKLEELWDDNKTLFRSAGDVSKASLVDELYKSERRLTNPHYIESASFNSLMIISNELMTLLPAYDTEMMGILTNIYDCKPYAESRRSRGSTIQMVRPQLGLIAATTPSQLLHFLPQGAWDQGFMSRTFLVYSDESKPTSLFDQPEIDKSLFNKLRRDFTSIVGLEGPMVFTKEAALAVDNWQLSGGHPRPTHPKLQSYVTRRTAHMLKLMMVMSVARGDSLQIEKEDFDLALDWMIEIEQAVPEIFKATSTSSSAEIVQEAWDYVFRLYQNTGKPVPQAKIYHFLQMHVPINLVQVTYQTMLDSGIFKAKNGGIIPTDKINTL